ncbi:hypothetical protein CR513_18178, partial [Mucuna pruriens]
MPYDNIVILDLIMDVVRVYFNMLCVFIKHRIDNYMNGCLTITVESYRRRMRHLQINKESFKPYKNPSRSNPSLLVEVIPAKVEYVPAGWSRLQVSPNKERSIPARQTRLCNANSIISNQMTDSVSKSYLDVDFKADGDSNSDVDSYLDADFKADADSYPDTDSRVDIDFKLDADLKLDANSHPSGFISAHPSEFIPAHPSGFILASRTDSTSTTSNTYANRVPPLMLFGHLWWNAVATTSNRCGKLIHIPSMNSTLVLVMVQVIDKEPTSPKNVIPAKLEAAIISNPSKLHAYDPKIDRIFHRLLRNPRCKIDRDYEITNSDFGVGISQFRLDNMANNDKTLKELTTLDIIY